MVLGRLEKMEQEGSYVAPPAGHVQVRLGHVTATTPEQAQRMARLGVIAEVNVGSNMVTGALRRRRGEVDRLGQHPLGTLLYYGVKTVLSTDAQGVMSTSLPKEYGLADEIIQRFRRGESKLTIPDPDDPGSSKTIAWKDLTPDQQERFDVGFLERTARGEAAKGRWDGTYRGSTGGMKIRRMRLTPAKKPVTDKTRTDRARDLTGANRRPGTDRLLDRLALTRANTPEMMRTLLERAPPDAPRANIIMNLIRSSDVVFEDLMSAAMGSSSPELIDALREFQEELADWLERELRKRHANARIRVSGQGSSCLQMVVEGGDQIQASAALEEICLQTYGRDWERSLGVQIREPLQQQPSR